MVCVSLVVVDFVRRWLSEDRAAGACSSAHVPRAGNTGSPPLLRYAASTTVPIQARGSGSSAAQRAHRKPGTSGGGRSEVKEEGRVFSGPEDMSGVPHPMAPARATRQSEISRTWGNVR